MSRTVEYVIDTLIQHYVDGTLNPAAPMDAIRVLVSRCYDYSKYSDDESLSYIVSSAKTQAQDILFKKAHEAIVLLTSPMTLTQVHEAAQLIHPVVISDLVLKLLRALKSHEKGMETINSMNQTQIPATLQIIMEQFIH